MEQLYQDNPRHKSTYTEYKNRSFTDSLESYQNGAHKELLILRWNKRIPRIEIVLHFLKVLSKQDIKSLRLKIFRYLKEHNINAVATIELTRDGNGKPSNKVHIHILTDDNRRKHIIREILALYRNLWAEKGHFGEILVKMLGSPPESMGRKGALRRDFG